MRWDCQSSPIAGKKVRSELFVILINCGRRELSGAGSQRVLSGVLDDKKGPTEEDEPQLEGPKKFPKTRIRFSQPDSWEEWYLDCTFG